MNASGKPSEPDDEERRAQWLESLIASPGLVPRIMGYLRYAWWYQGRVRWALWLGIIVTVRGGVALAERFPTAAVWIHSIQVLLGAFLFVTWMARPFLHLLLRMNPEGRDALTADDLRGSNWFCSVLVGAIILAALSTVWGDLALMALVVASLLLPLARGFELPRGRKRTAYLAYTSVLALIALAGLVFSAFAPFMAPEVRQYGFLFFVGPMIGAVLVGVFAGFADR